MLHKLIRPILIYIEYYIQYSLIVKKLRLIFPAAVDPSRMTAAHDLIHDALPLYYRYNITQL